MSDIDTKNGRYLATIRPIQLILKNKSTHGFVPLLPLETLHGGEIFKNHEEEVESLFDNV